MELLNGTLLEVKGPMQELIKADLPVKDALALVKLSLKVNEYLIPVETLKNKLVVQYGTRMPNGQVGVEPGDEKWEGFVVKYAELLAEPIEIDVKPIILTAEGIKISAASIVALDQFITFR